MQKIVLDVIPSGIRPRVYVNQYDIGREFQITFKEGLGEYYFANGTTIKINGKKADNHVFEYTQSDKWDSTHYIISTSGSGASKVVTIATAEQMTAAAGDADVQLTLQNSAGAVIGTLDFVMVVQARPSAVGDPSESDLPDIVRSVNNISPDANGNVQLGPVPGGIGAHNISTVEATRQMSTSYSAGDYVYVTADDQLYKITSPIGAGGTLTPGTNAVSCTISSDLSNKGQAEEIGASLVTTISADFDIALSKALSNFKSVLICIYGGNSKTDIYGSTFFPVFSVCPFSSGLDIHMRTGAATITGVLVVRAFNSANTKMTFRAGNGITTSQYVVIYGIK